MGVLLLVEDDDAERYVWRKIAGGLGHQVVAVDNAANALMALENDRGITALITDIQLGAGMSGVDMARAAMAARPDLKVLFITASELPANLPPAPVLKKPFPDSALIKALNDLLDEAAR